MAYLVNELKEL